MFTPAQARIITDICTVQMESFTNVYVEASQKEPATQKELEAMDTTVTKWLDQIGDSTIEFQKLKDNPDYILEMGEGELKQVRFIFKQLEKYYVDSTPKAYNNLGIKLEKLTKIHKR